MICKNCGNEYDNENFKYCPQCGEPAVNDEVIAEQADVQAENQDISEVTDLEETSEISDVSEISEEGEAPEVPAPKKSGVGGKIAAVVIIAAILGGTGYMAYQNADKIPEVKTESINKADAFENIPQDKLIEDYDSVVEVFDNALKAIDDADSVTVDTINKNTEGDVNSNELELIMKKDLTSGSLVAEMEIKQNSVYEASTEDASGSSSSAPQTETESNNVKYFFTDNMLYCDTGESKMKMETAEEDMAYQLNSYGMEIYSEYISKASCVEKGKNKIYTVGFDAEAYQEFMLNNMAASGASMPENEEIKLNYANISFEVDADGVLVNYAFIIDLDDTLNGETTNYNSVVTVSVVDYNKTTVNIPDESILAEYVDPTDASNAEDAAQDSDVEDMSIAENESVAMEETELESK